MQRLTLQQSFMNGLRNDPYVNGEFLQKCLALKPTMAGLKPFRAIEIMTDPPDVDWPGNRVEDVGSTTLVFNRDGIYTIDSPSEKIPVFTAVLQTSGITNPTGVSSISVPAGPWVTSGPKPDLRPQGIIKIAAKRETTTDTSFTVKTLGGTVIGTWDLGDDWNIASFVKDTDDPVTYHVVPTSKAGTLRYECKAHWATPYTDPGPWNFVKSEEFNDVWFVQAAYDHTIEGCDAGRFILFHIPSNGTVGAHPSMKWAVMRFAGGDAQAAEDGNRFVASVARHMGRLYMGGFHPDNKCFASTIEESGSVSWEYFWNSFLENVEVEITHEGMTIGKNIVFYSKLNGGDYFWPFAVEMAMLSCPSSSAFEDAVPFLLDAVRKKEIGFFEVPTVGTIQRLESVDRILYIFATDGVFMSVQNPTDFGTGHAVFKVSDVPLKELSAAINKGVGVYYVNANNRLCFAGPEGVQVIGYELQLKTLEDAIQMDYDNEEDDLYISGSNRCFVLTRTGLGEYGASVSSFVARNGVLTGYTGELVKRNGRVLALFCTETLDFIERMLKDIHSIELGITAGVNIRYRILYRIHGDPGWESTEWMPVYDTSGFTTPITSGHDLRLELELELQGLDQDEYTKIEYVNLLWKRTDKRNFRLHRGGRL